mmetsp:Transcript_24196/g.61295  ORF Transcript_24196/g.61295 Transcript_24196/m.61295 type:complete len:206 (-) Transcript_24196:514-1131(-)
MPLSHRVVAQVLHQRQVDHHRLHVGHQLLLHVPLDELLGQRLDLLEQLLGLVHHPVHVHVLPERRAVGGERLLHQRRVVPRQLEEVKLGARRLELLEWVHGEVEELLLALAVKGVQLDFLELAVPGVQQRVGALHAHVVLEGRLLFEDGGEVVHTAHEVLHLLLDLLGLQRLQRTERLARVDGRLLHLLPLEGGVFKLFQHLLVD